MLLNKANKSLNAFLLFFIAVFAVAEGDEMIDAVNQERIMNGLQPLQQLDLLNQAAKLQSDYQAITHLMSHDGIPYLQPINRVNAVGILSGIVSVGENVAYTSAGISSIAEVVHSWMNSPLHRANMLGDFNFMGWSKSTGTDNLTYWSQVFLKSSIPLMNTLSPAVSPSPTPTQSNILPSINQIPTDILNNIHMVTETVTIVVRDEEPPAATQILNYSY